MATMSASVSVYITCVMVLLIYAPVTIYHLTHYWRRQQHPVYTLRYSNITIIQCALFIIKLLYDLIFVILMTYVLEYHSTQRKIMSTVNAYLAAYFLYSFVWKFWLLRHDIVTNNIVINSLWKSVINPNKYKAKNSSFYAKYRKKCGNPTFVLCLLLMLSTLMTTGYNITILFFPYIYTDFTDNSDLVSLCASWDYIIPYILLVIIYFTIPKFTENFYVMREMKYIFMCLSVNFISYYVYLVLFALLYGHISPQAEDLGILIESNLILLSQFCAIVISTKWVNDRCQKIINSERYAVRRVPYELQLTQHHWLDIKPSPKLSTSTSSNLRILETLTSSRLYHSFMNHLSKEMCIECLLSVTEFLQFRNHIKSILHITKELEHLDVDDLYSDTDVDADESQLFSISLPPDVPISWIVHNTEWDPKRKAYELYKKYVAEGSEFQINISWGQRRYFEGLFADYDAFRRRRDMTEGKLLYMFDECCHVMVQLMTASMSRFHTKDASIAAAE